MPVNKWLCKTFDETNKGYVTIGDVWHVIPIIMVGVAVIYGYLYGLYNWLWNDFKITETSALMNDAAHIWFIGITIILALVLVLIFLCCIEDVKIVTCKRVVNEDDEE